MSEVEGVENKTETISIQKEALKSFDADKYLRLFEEDVGCQINTIASTLQSQTQQVKENNWTTFSKNKDELKTFVEIYTIVMGVIAYTLKTKQISKKPSKNSIKALTVKLLSKLPKSNKNKPILTKSIYMTNLHCLLNEIHDSLQDMDKLAISDQNQLQIISKPKSESKIDTVASEDNTVMTHLMQQQVPVSFETDISPIDEGQTANVVRIVVVPVEFEKRYDFVKKKVKDAQCDSCFYGTIFLWYFIILIYLVLLTFLLVMFRDYDTYTGFAMISIITPLVVIDICLFGLIIFGMHRLNCGLALFGAIWAGIHVLINMLLYWLVVPLFVAVLFCMVMVTNSIYARNIGAAQREYYKIMYPNAIPNCC